MKGSVMREELMETKEINENEVDEAKREFMKKFGKYAATAPLGMYLLMGPGASKAQASGSTTHCHAGGTVTWTANWGNCHIKQYVHYEADGNPNGKCVIDLKTSFYSGDVRITVLQKHDLQVEVQSQNGQYHAVMKTTVDQVMNDPFWSDKPLYKILTDLNLHS